MKKIIVLAAVVLLSGCQYDEDARLKNPTLEDIQGRWESSSISTLVPYALLEIDQRGNGIAAIANKDGAAVVLVFNGFHSYEQSFEVTATFFEEPFGAENESEIIGGYIEYGQLCFGLPEEDEELPSFCFTRSQELEGFRLDASTAIGEFDR